MNWPTTSTTKSSAAKSSPRAASTSSPAPNCRTNRISPRARATPSSIPITTTSSPPSSNAGKGLRRNRSLPGTSTAPWKEHRLLRRRPPIISDGQGIHRRPRTVVASPLGLCRGQTDPEPAHPLHQPPPLRQRPARSPAGTVLYDAILRIKRTDPFRIYLKAYPSPIRQRTADSLQNRQSFSRYFIKFSVLPRPQSLKE